MRTILLGEAPKRTDGFAFDADSWTTQQIAGVLGIDPFDLNKAFWVMNVFEDPQWTTRRGFDRFSIGKAADEIDAIWFKSRRIICVGSRVAAAMEWSLNLPESSIPANRFELFQRTCRGGEWELARIPHPSGLRSRLAFDDYVLPSETISFLRTAARIRDAP